MCCDDPTIQVTKAYKEGFVYHRVVQYRRLRSCSTHNPEYPAFAFDCSPPADMISFPCETLQDEPEAVEVRSRTGFRCSAPCIRENTLTYGDHMYCPSCGDQSTQGLKYCKRCGASLGAPFETASRKFPTPLTAMFLVLIAGITTVGLVAPFAAENLTRTFSTHDIMIILFGSWIVILLLDAMLIWLLLRLIGVSQQFAGKVQRERSFPEERIHEELAEPPQSIGSVTENTTRSFKLPRYEPSSEGSTDFDVAR